MKNLYNIDDWTDNSYLRLGEILLEAGKINLFHLSMVLDVQRFKKMPMGEIFLAMKIVNKEDLQQALHVQNVIQKRCNNA
ncbi:MAG: hypothetical protein LUH05_08110 [Candidatus Gastranaerophilales bacterium]|nr:hypothetical protein [Candidatus Gastranaerophilales bacterium]